MRKRTMLALVLMMLWTAAPVAAQDGGTPNPTSEPSEPIDVTEACLSAVEGLDALKEDLEWPDHLMEENAVRTEADFDINDYFTVLDRLSVEEGYKLDYVYQYDGMGGYPVLYTYPADQEPLLTYAGYSEKYSEATPRDYLERIVIEDTPEGYLQAAILDVTGRQFYLFWHANYNDWRIICDSESLEALLTADNGFGSPISEEVQAQAREIDVTPVVELDEDTTQVTVIMFTNWGGFYRTTFTISRDYPREVFTSGGGNVVYYDCGIMF